MLFFGGGVLDSLVAFLMGVLVFYISVLASSVEGLSEIECFLSSFMVTLLTSLLNKHTPKDQLCLYGQLFGGVVWLLPGFSITVSLLEIYSKMIVFGASR
jgi:uncharacterized membrane protein YjjP (DUF1212 family)